LYGRNRAAAFSLAEIFASASRFENFGMSAVEALSASIPVVVLRGSVAVARTSATAIAVADSDDELGEAMLDVAKRLGPELRAQARRTYEEINASELSATYHEMYRLALER
jgi:glycosyltransferase involved in cell wall biosynthesis